MFFSFCPESPIHFTRLSWILGLWRGWKPFSSRPLCTAYFYTSVSIHMIFPHIMSVQQVWMGSLPLRWLWSRHFREGMTDWNALTGMVTERFLCFSHTRLHLWMLYIFFEPKPNFGCSKSCHLMISVWLVHVLCMNKWSLQSFRLSYKDSPLGLPLFPVLYQSFSWKKAYSSKCFILYQLKAWNTIFWCIFLESVSN